MYLLLPVIIDPKVVEHRKSYLNLVSLKRAVSLLLLEKLVKETESPDSDIVPVVQSTPSPPYIVDFSSYS
jgi:hypothetical protein